MPIELWYFTSQVFISLKEKMKKFLFFLTGVLFLHSCGTYKNAAYNSANNPTAPNYADSNSWAVLPNNYPEVLSELLGETTEKKADVFFVYPTLFTDKKDPAWNADVFSSSHRDQVLNQSILYQASAWGAAANIYAPYYRQAHYRIFVEPFTSQGEEAWELAYQDVKNAFEYYLKNYNENKPIIVASHSQGSMHLKRLVKEYFDGTQLQSRLIGAYLVGTKVEPDFFSKIPEATSSNQIGGVMSWNSYKKNKRPSYYEKSYKGGITTNPITWNDQRQTKITEHQGLLYTDLELYPKSLSLQKIDGMLWVTVPKIPKRFLMSLISNYHFADVNLFWKDISINALERTEEWFNSNEK